MIDILAAIVAVVTAVAAVIALVATRRPDMFTIERSASIRAPAERIYPLIANLRAMNTWNPFVAPDPNIEITYSGPESGTGARHTWRGNRNVGEGSIEITEASAPTNVAMRLIMLKPMAADNAVRFKLTPRGEETMVSWSMAGRQPFMAKFMTMFIDCDKMVGSGSSRRASPA